MSELVEFLKYLNESGSGIPLQVIQTTQVNWVQFGLSIFIAALGSFFIFYLLFQNMKNIIVPVIMKIKLASIKKHSKRNILLIKHTERAMFSQSMIEQKTLAQVGTALAKFKGKDFDLILHTPGGDIFFTLFISRLLKAYPGNIRAIIPQYSMSGGTFLALSCDEIVMDNASCLGPVDPQLGSMFKFGSAKSWDKILKFKGKKAEDSSISMAYTGKQYTKTLASVVSSLIEDKIPIKSQRAKVVKVLTSGEIEHAFALTKNQMKSMGFKISDLDSKTSKILSEVMNSDSFEGVLSL